MRCICSTSAIKEHLPDEHVDRRLPKQLRDFDFGEDMIWGMQIYTLQNSDRPVL
jgi:hypothetical protein